MPRPAEFANRISRWAEDDIFGIAMTAMTRFMLRIGDRAVMLSPVKTGHFVWNWTIVPLGETGSEIPGADPGRSRVKARMRQEMAAFLGGGGARNSLGQFSRGLSLINATPYSQELEDGSSRQAPEGILRIVAAEARTFT
jgi:hypothetical protein